MDHGQAASRVFAVPELLAQIINELAQTYPTQKDDSYIASLTEISPLALVSRNWVRPIQDQVWRSAKSVSLRRVHPWRRQNFANKIRRLHVMDRNDVAGLDVLLPSLALTFPVLEEVIIGNPKLHLVKDYDADDLTQLLWIVLGPKVRSVSLMWAGSYHVEAILQTFKRQCPPVSSLRLSVNGAGGTELLQGLIEGLPHLESLGVLHPPMTPLRRGAKRWNPPLFYWLSKVSGVRSLSFASCMTPRCPLETFQVPETEGVREPVVLPYVRSLAGRILTCTQIWPLCATMPFLTHLTLDIGLNLGNPAAENHPLLQLTSLYGLKSLHMYGPPFYRPDKEELCALISFPGLISLRMGHSRHYYDLFYSKRHPDFRSLVEAHELEDDVFLQICKAMPLLEEMKLWMDHKLTGNSLATLGRQCRKLKTLLLPGEFHLLRLIDTAAAEDTPLFPALRRLSTEPLPLAKFSTTTSSNASLIALEAKASFINQHTPKLARAESAWRPAFEVRRSEPQRKDKDRIIFLELQRRKEEHHFFQFSRPGGWEISPRVEEVSPIKTVDTSENPKA